MSPERVRQQILLIDDMKDVLLVVGRRLQALGYDVLTANSGEEGLRIAEERLPDLVLLDIMMPHLKGREVCARLKANPATQRIPVIFLTALGLADHVTAGMELGADDYIVKPFDTEDLRDRIRVCLLRAKGRTPPATPPPPDPTT